jgi:hypothetical protein
MFISIGGNWGDVSALPAGLEKGKKAWCNAQQIVAKYLEKREKKRKKGLQLVPEYETIMKSVGNQAAARLARRPTNENYKSKPPGN